MRPCADERSRRGRPGARGGARRLRSFRRRGAGKESHDEGFAQVQRTLAHSWALSWCLYRLHGIRLIGSPREEIWYFAYGANMHDSTFRQWRGMCPREWRPGRVRGYRLRFNLKAPPRGRAIYANLSADPAAEVWGVLYRITRRDLVWVGATEGVPWWRYRPLSLDAEDLSGTTLPAVAYIAKGTKTTASHRYGTLPSYGRARERTAYPKIIFSS